MRLFRAGLACCVVVAAFTPVSAAVASSAAARPAGYSLQAVSGAPDTKVIVLMKNQLADLPATADEAARRATAIATNQASALNSVRRSGARAIKPFRVLNGFAATVSAGEAAALKSDPAVASVLPDSVMAAPTMATARDSATSTGPASIPGSAAGLCDSGAAGKPQLNPQATVLTHSDSDVPGALTARSLGMTGAGVKVGLIAEGIDVANPDFIRPDGSRVITDYQDFSGDGTAAPTDGAEAFLDATSIAAQGRQTYDVSHFSKLPLNAPCRIRIEGVAPGSSIVALKVFAQNDANTFSNALQAIDYAVSVDHVNIMNESYGFVPFPDSDMLALDELNDQIIAAGVTVVASSGDSGITNAIWAPSTDPAVISVGATTAYRFDLQTGYAFSRGAKATGHVDNNISSLSSGGVSQAGRTVDLVAPGELDFGVCTASAQYTGCLNYAGESSDVEAIGGTSQSGPVVAGAAALVIQAYRKTHGGATPSPAVVKAILTSTADDVNAPATQQGAGLLDSYKAVELALSYPNSSAATGSTLLAGATHLNVAAAPGTHYARTVKLTNAGTRSQTITAASRALGAYHEIAESTVTLSDSASPHAVDFQGLTDNVETIKFTVPSGVDRLDTRVAWQGASAALSARVRLTLIDPARRIAGYSLPQGIGNYGDSQVAAPKPGVWTAYITSRTTDEGGSAGPVVFGAFSAGWQTAGAVSPSTFTLAPGASQVVRYSSTVPTQPGDTSASLVIHSTVGAPSPTTTIPIVVRSQTTLTPAAQHFTDTITGPNGRGFASSVGRFFDLNVPANMPELNVNIREGAHGNPFLALLVSPEGQAIAQTSSDLVGSHTGAAAAVASVAGGQLHVLNPMPGLWRVIITFGAFVRGDALSMGYSVEYDAAKVPVSSAGVPNSATTTLVAGHTVTASVTVHNNGTTAESVFLDPRLKQTKTYSVAVSPDTVALPNASGSAGVYVLPTRTTSMTETVSSSVPVSYDVSANDGGPDYIGASSGTTSTGTNTASPLTQGVWFLVPSEVGPYGTGPGPSATAAVKVSMLTQAFDTAVAARTGDFWLQSIDASAPFAPVIVPAGQTVTIPVTITPNAAQGTVVRGALVVGQLVSTGTPYGFFSPDANEVAALPYSYTVG